MENVYYSHMFTAAKRTNDSQFVTECVLVSTHYEATASIIVAVDSFCIQEARWDIYRSPGSHRNGGNEVRSLHGVEAYLQAGEALRAVAESEGELPRELLTECIKAAIQAETYLFRERGFASAADYDAYWKKRYLNSCRLYSNLERASHSWHGHVASRMWGDRLINRFKSAVIEKQDEGIWGARGSFADSFHDISACLTTDDGIVSACSGRFLRAPDLVCWENTDYFNRLEGLCIDNLTAKTLRDKVGGSQGCSHVADLLLYLVTSLKQALRLADTYSAN